MWAKLTIASRPRAQKRSLAHKKKVLDNVVEKFDKLRRNDVTCTTCLFSHRARDFAIFSYTTPIGIVLVFAADTSWGIKWSKTSKKKNYFVATSPGSEKFFGEGEVCRNVRIRMAIKIRYFLQIFVSFRSLRFIASRWLPHKLRGIVNLLQHHFEKNAAISGKHKIA